MKSATRLLLKRKVPDHGQNQRENHLHSKTRLPDYHDSAANVANSAFYSNGVTDSRPIATPKQKKPCHFVSQSIKITSHVVHFRSEKHKNSVYFAASGIALLWLFFHLNCSVVYPALSIYNTWARGTSNRYDEPGRVGILAVRAVVFWALSIVVSARLIETTLLRVNFWCKLQYFFNKFENQTQVCHLG